MNQRTFLEGVARRAMVAHGLEPDWSDAATAELARLGTAPLEGRRDLRALPWSSIDNDDSRDLDQIEVCVEEAGRPLRLLVAIADVDALVRKGSAIDDHARTNTTSVYTPAEIFPMLPAALSTGKTSLNQGEDRPAIVIDITIDGTCGPTQGTVYTANVRNHAQLAYPAVAAWLDGDGPAPAPLAAVPGLEAQLRQQAEIAKRLRACRDQEGALDFDRVELRPVMDRDRVQDLQAAEPDHARDIIEDFMIAANGVTARFLSAHGVPSIRRVVRSPERWARIVDLAAQHGAALPPQPDARALAGFLEAQRAAAPQDFSDLSLSVIKLLGRGEYVAAAPGTETAHFALAVSSYTHSTAPNRRFPDLLVQRLLKAAFAGAAAPYDLDRLTVLAQHCTQQEDAANKVERLVRKAAAALYLSDRIGQEFDAVVTGAGDKGTWVRITRPPVEGRLERGATGLDVGDRLRVRLISTNPERGFIDFARTR
ncbi:MAG TPA: RNB domain-containing ribonuclease [Vicinamibacterales bacterium]|nr:RNB domain-containing ribonuclease [Vicinamibacterales bacterium]